MAGTLKKGAAVAANTTTRWNFISPAGQVLTMRTQKDPSIASDVGQSAMHGAGSSAPYAIAEGNGEPTWKTEIAKHEWFQVVAKAKAAGLPIQGTGGIRFDMVTTTIVQGIPKMTTEVKSCTIGKIDDKTSADGSMVSLEGMCLQVLDNGVPRFAEGV